MSGASWRRIKKRMVLLIASIGIAVFWTFCVSAGDKPEEQKVLRVAFPQANGYTMTDENGRRHGIVVDFLNEISKYTGWEYEYIDVENELLLDEFFDGAYDLMGGTYYSDGFEEYFAYPSYNCGYAKLVLMALTGNREIKSYDLNTLNGKTIGVYSPNTENIRRLKEYLKINDLNCTLKYYDYDDQKVTGNLDRFLQNGEVDLLLSNSADAADGIYPAAVFDSQPHYIVTQPGNQEIIDGLNMALENLYESDPDFSTKVYAKSFPEAARHKIELNDRERAYIQEKKNVTVAVPSDWHPMLCLENEDGHNGIVADVLAEISEFTGLEFTYVYCDSYADALHKIEAGEAELLGFFIGNEEVAAREGLSLTASYMSLDSILVRNKKASYPAEGLVGGILGGRALPDFIEAEEIIFYSKASDALADVNKGKLDFFYGISSHLEDIIQHQNYMNIVQVNLINDSLDISFALKKPCDTHLLSVINKAVNTLSEEQKERISSRNLISLGNNRMTLSSIIYANPEVALGTALLFTALALLCMAVVTRSRLHAAAIQNDLEKAEADSRAKSEFLSRMSHEIRTPMNAIIGLTDLTRMEENLPEKASENLTKIKASSKYMMSLLNDILDMSRIESGKMELASEPFSLGALLDDIDKMMETEAKKRGIRYVPQRDYLHDVVVGDPIRLRQVILNLLSNAFKFTPSGGTVSPILQEDSSTERDAVYTIRVTDNGVGIQEADQQRIFKSFEQSGTNITKSQGTGLGLPISSSIVKMMGGELKLKSEFGRGSEFFFTVTLPKGGFITSEEDEEAVEETRSRLLDGVNILMAEDNELNAEIAIELLELQGASVTWAENGRTALEQFQESRPGTYRILLMDLMMPEMDGLEAARAIRSLPREDAETVPILALSANSFKQDEEKALAAGMNGFISKPIDVENLYRQLNQALKSGTGSGSAGREIRGRME